MEWASPLRAKPTQKPAASSDLNCLRLDSSVPPVHENCFLRMYHHTVIELYASISFWLIRVPGARPVIPTMLNLPIYTRGLISLWLYKENNKLRD
jgi:hypothetical protein